MYIYSCQKCICFHENLFRFTFTDHLRNDLEFGPVFQPKFLKEVLKLQQRIEGLTFEYEEDSGMVNTFNLSEV